MPRQHNRLTDLILKQAKAGARPCDGDGLYFYCSAPGRGSWVLRYRWRGKDRHMGLGSYPVVSIAKARTKTKEQRERLGDGRDPIQARNTDELNAVSTFRDWSIQFIADRGKNWNPKHRHQQERRLEKYAYPSMGALTIKEIDTRKVKQLLSPLWDTKTKTAKMLRSLIERVWDYAAVLSEWEGSNPARWRGRLDKVLTRVADLPRSKVAHSFPTRISSRFMQRCVEGKVFRV